MPKAQKLGWLFFLLCSINRRIWSPVVGNLSSEDHIMARSYKLEKGHLRHWWEGWLEKVNIKSVYVLQFTKNELLLKQNDLGCWRLRRIGHMLESRRWYMWQSLYLTSVRLREGKKRMSWKIDCSIWVFLFEPYEMKFSYTVLRGGPLVYLSQ